jgi:hypothetical protein
MLASYYTRSMFPEYGSDPTMNDKTIYNTVVRIAGSSTNFALAFQAVFRLYGWKRFVILSDQAPLSWCTYGSAAISKLMSSQTVIPITMKTSGLLPSDYAEYLDGVRKNGRSMYCMCTLYYVAVIRLAISPR